MTNGTTVTYVGTVAGMTSAVSSTGNTKIKLLRDISYPTGTITFLYSCTIDFNGHTVTTKQTSGNGLYFKAAGSENQITTVKNGTLLAFEIAIRVDKGAVVVDNMTVRTKSGSAVGLYETNGAYKDINRVTNSTLSSGLYGAIVFNNKNADFSATGITVDNSVLIAEKAGGAAVLNQQSGVKPGFISLGENVDLYSRGNTMAVSGILLPGKSTTKSTGQSVQICDTTLTGMNMWTTSQIAAINPETNKVYVSISEAMQDMGKTGGTLQLRQDLNQSAITIYNGVTLDLNGKTVDTKYFTCYGSVIDSGNGGNALLKASKNLHIAGQDSYLPIYDTAAGGYRFYKYEMKTLGTKAGTNSVKFGFRLELSNTDGYDVLAATSDEALDTFAYLSWGSLPAPLVYQFRDSTLRNYATQAKADITTSGSTNKAIVLTVSGTDVLESSTVLSVENSIVSTAGVTANGDANQWTVP